MMTELRGCYQNAVADKQQWKLSVRKYWEKLKDHNPDAVKRAFAIADDVYREFMPSRGQMVELARKFEKDIASTAPRLTEGEAWDPDGSARARQIIDQLSGKLRIESEKS